MKSDIPSCDQADRPAPLDPDVIEKVLASLRAALEERGMISILLVDGDGLGMILERPDLARATEKEARALSSEPDNVRSYSLNLICKPCQKKGKHKGQRLCWVAGAPIGGDQVGSWYPCPT